MADPASGGAPDDPPPQPPERPAAGECCDSGCDPCVLDLYAQALECHRIAYQAWQARQAERQPGRADPDGPTATR